MMTSLVDRVEARIRAQFGEGLPLSADVCHYIEGTLGAVDPVTVADLLNGPAESDRDTLLELVFFPDADFQRGLETVLGGAALASTAQALLAGRLKTTPVSARLIFPAHPRRLDCDLPADGVNTVLTRLSLGWSLDARLRETLERWVAERKRAGRPDFFNLLVRLRNAGLAQTQGQVGLLNDFLERMPAVDSRWDACFDFLMAFLPAYGDTLNFYPTLMARKVYLLRHLMQARRQAEQMSRSNMETLHATGFRAAHFDTAAAEQALGCIDAIALAVYGRTEHFDGTPLSMDLGTMGAADIQGVLRRLL